MSTLLEAVIQRALFYPADFDERFSDLPRSEWSELPGVFSIDHDVAALIATHGLWKKLTAETGLAFDLFEDVLIESAALEGVAQGITEFAEATYRGREQETREVVGSVVVGSSETLVVAESATARIDQTLRQLSVYLEQRRAHADDVVASL